jgi:uncharacterized DUF497 family protein
VRITFDPTKRALTLQERGLDFMDAAEVFAGPTATFEDDRFDYGEVRLATVGYLGERLVQVIWTQREDSRRVISMRHVHADETEVWRRRMDRSG